MSGDKASKTAATMETQRGAKAPLVSFLSQAFAHPRSHPLKSPVLLPTLLDGHTQITLALQKTKTNKRAAN